MIWITGVARTGGKLIRNGNTSPPIWHPPSLHLASGLQLQGPHSHLATTLNSFADSHTVPRVTISRDNKTFRRYVHATVIGKCGPELCYTPYLEDVVDPAHQPLVGVGGSGCRSI